jgi:hypothetical protein
MNELQEQALAEMKNYLTNYYAVRGNGTPVPSQNVTEAGDLLAAGVQQFLNSLE